MKKYKLVTQHNSGECAVACLQSIFNYYNIETHYHFIKSVLMKYGGQNLGALVNASKEFGFEGAAYCVDTLNLSVITNEMLPCIVRVYTKEKTDYHYVVIYEINNNEVIVGDPAIGVLKYIISQFKKIWTGYVVIFKKIFDINHEDKTSFKNSIIHNIIGESKTLYVGLLFCSLFIAVIGSVESLYIKIITDNIIPHNAKTMLIFLIILFCGIHILNESVYFFRTKAVNYIERKNGSKLTSYFFEKLVKKSSDFYRFVSEGDLITRIKDVEKVNTLVQSYVLLLSFDLFCIIVGSLIVIIYSWKLFLILAIPCILVFMIMTRMNKKLYVLTKKFMQENSSVTSGMLQALNNINSIKCFSREEEVIRNNKKKIDTYYYDVENYMNKINTYNNIIKIIKGLSDILLLGIGTYFVIENQVTFGTLLVCNTLILYVWNPLLDIINLQPTFMSGKSAIERLEDVFIEGYEDEEKEKGEERENDFFSGDLIVDNISFAYSNGWDIIADWSLIIKKNHITGIVGKSGSGKSTLAKLIVRFFDVKSGNIYLSKNIEEDRINKSIYEFSKRTIRENILYLESECNLLNQSILDNLKFYNEDVSEADIEYYCKLTGLTRVVNNLPEGINTVISDSVDNISQGQKQLILLTRALIYKPKILILDEITSHMDKELEMNILEILKKLKETITIILITHDDVVKENCDCIISLDC